MAKTGLELEARRQLIVDRLNSDGRVKVSELSSSLGFSEVTIRHDLNTLEKKGLLERVPGGAVVRSGGLGHSFGWGRKISHMEAKKSIASALCDMIHDGETLLINSGSTSLITAMELKRHQRLNILTNSIAVAMELSDYPTFRVILLGGNMNTQYLFTYSSDALAQLSKYKADKAILSVDGIDSHSGISTYHAEEAEVNVAMVNRSHQTIIVADSSKLGRESFHNFASLRCIDCLVTNKDADQEQLRAIRSSGVDLLTV